MAATDLPNPYREQALDLQVYTYRALANAYLDMNPDGFEDRRHQLQHFVDQLAGVYGPEKQDREWRVLHDAACRVNGTTHAYPVPRKVRTQVLGGLMERYGELIQSDGRAEADPFAGLPS